MKRILQKRSETHRHSLYVQCATWDLLLFSILNLKSTNAMDNLIEIYYDIN